MAPAMLLPLLLAAASPALDAQRAFEVCLETQANAAARAGVEKEAFETLLPKLCAEEEARLVAAVSAQRTERDAALTGRREGAGPGEKAARDYAKGLRGVVEAGYATLLQLRGPAPDPNRYPYGGLVRPDASRAEPVPPPLGPDAAGPTPTGVPPLGPRGKRVTVPSGTGAPATPPSSGAAPPRPAPQPRRVRVPQG